MIESNIEGGNQPIPNDLSKLRYGCSVTDPCIDWSTTETMIRKEANILKEACRNEETMLPIFNRKSRERQQN